MRILYLGWQGTGNIGDELLYDQFKDWAYKSQNPQLLRIDSWNPTHSIYAKDLSPYDWIVLGGGSLLCLEPYLDILIQAIRLNRPIYIWSSGMDLLPFELVDRFLQGNRVNLRSDWSLLNKTKFIMEHAKFVSVRGPLTYQYLRSLGIERDIEIIGDPGLFIDKSSATIELPPTFTNQEKLAAVNWGQMKSSLYYGNEENVFQELVHICEYLLNNNFQLVLYAMHFVDLERLNHLYARLQEKHFDSIHLVKTIYSADSLVNLLSQCELSINIKLHANILSFAAGTPAIQLGYGFKSFDFAASIEQLHSAISTSDENLFEKVTHLIHHPNLIQINRERFNNKLQQYQQKQEEALQVLFLRR